MAVLLIVTLTGCPRMRACIDHISPDCIWVGRRFNVRCCHMGAVHLCDLDIYRDTAGISGYRLTNIMACVGPLGRCREDTRTCR